MKKVLWLTGTPFYPMGLTRNTNEMSNFYPNSWHSTFLGSGRPEVFPLAVTAVGKIAGICHVLALLAFPITLGWLAGSALLLRTAPEGNFMASGRWLLTFLTAGAGAVLLVTPWAIETEPDTLNQLHWGYLPVRFGQCFLSLTVLALGLVFADVSQVFHRLDCWIQGSRHCLTRNYCRGKKILKVFFVSGSVLPALLFAGLLMWQIRQVVRSPFFILRSPFLDHTLLAADFAIGGLSMYLLVHNSTHLGRWAIWLVLLLITCAGLAWGGNTLAGNWHAKFASHYDAMFTTRLFTVLEKRNAATTRICAMDYRYYPFFGSRRQFRVCCPKKAFSYPWLIDYLHEQKVNVVACLADDAYLYARYLGVSSWMQNHSEIFNMQKEDSRFLWAEIDSEQLEKAVQPQGVSP